MSARASRISLRLSTNNHARTARVRLRTLTTRFGTWHPSPLGTFPKARKLLCRAHAFRPSLRLAGAVEEPIHHPRRHARPGARDWRDDDDLRVAQRGTLAAPAVSGGGAA